MKPSVTLTHEFVDSFPVQLSERTLYVSIRFASAAHNCACGCGNQVITPISTTDWQLMYDGETITLYPSIGNWNFPCKSHYFIRRNKVQWAAQWTKEQIDASRRHDQWVKDQYHENPSEPTPLTDPPLSENPKNSGWRSLKKRFLP